MRIKSTLMFLGDKDLSNVRGGSGVGPLGEPSTAKSIMEAWRGFDYNYINSEFMKPVAKETVAALAGGYAATRNPVGTFEAGLGGLAYSATSHALDQDFSKWIKPDPAPSWADFRRLDARR